MTLMTPAQLAAQHPISRSMIYCACQDGLLPHYRVPAKKGARGKVLVAESDFLAWLESHKHGTGPKAGECVSLAPITPR